MYDIVSELNASKTQVFECKQDCGRYLSFHCHMQSHFCEYCSCIHMSVFRDVSEFTMIHQLKLTSAYVTINVKIV